MKFDLHLLSIKTEFDVNLMFLLLLLLLLPILHVSEFC